MLGALQFLLIALVTLPLAGVPLAILLVLDYRRDSKRIVPADHVVESVT